LTGCSNDEPPISGKLRPIQLKNLEGLEINLDYNDELLLLVFWATWCQPCLLEIPVLNELNVKYQGSGLRIVSILTDDPGIEIISNIKRTFEINYEILLGSEMLASQYGISAFPTSFLVIKGGKLVEKMIGLTPDNLYESKIQTHLPGS
jgi:thiol-disulfide isomerase/thioredoxin